MSKFAEGSNEGKSQGQQTEEMKTSTHNLKQKNVQHMFNLQLTHTNDGSNYSNQMCAPYNIHPD